MSFKNQREIFEHLLSGGKITHIDYTGSEYSYMDTEGVVLSEGGIIRGFFDCRNPQVWSKYEEPKKKKKITLYRYTVKDKRGGIFQTKWALCYNVATEGTEQENF